MLRIALLNHTQAADVTADSMVDVTVDVLLVFSRAVLQGTTDSEDLVRRAAATVAAECCADLIRVKFQIQPGTRCSVLSRMADCATLDAFSAQQQQMV